MERTKIDFKDAVGLTIEGIFTDIFSDQKLLIAFSGGKYAVIDTWYSSSLEESVLDTSGAFDHHDYDEDALLMVAGAAKVAEWQEAAAKKAAAMEAQRQEARRREFEKLKREFEGKVD